MKKVICGCFLLLCFGVVGTTRVKAQAPNNNETFSKASEIIFSDSTIAFGNSDNAVVNGIFDKKYVVIAKTTIIRSGPGTTYEKKGTLYYGDVISVSSISNGWAKFKLNGAFLYVKESDIELQ